MSIHIFGIRHHGPGCARSLRAALDELQPDVLVLEAPAEAESAFEAVRLPDMRPPVALLLYPRQEPQQAMIYPMAEFSPEWQALRWASAGSVPVRAMDLPFQTSVQAVQEPPQNPEALHEPSWRVDPIALLAEAAGYQDHELWWDEQIERRHDAAGLFQGIQNAMTAVRTEYPETSRRDALREAFMRKTIRSVVREGFQRVAVVCGAWHGPVLDEEAIQGKRPGLKVRDDTQRLKGLSRIKTQATWIPWTHSRLASRSGYGAGVQAPGWYAHLWHSLEDAPTRWIVNAARVLRDQDLPASSANVLDAVRLAETLAALRSQRAPGLAELNDAILTVMCRGDETPLRWIQRELEIGDALGTVPDSVPSVPLAEDLSRTQKRLRLKPAVQSKTLDLDLRQETSRHRSRLLHRLGVLGIPWGEPIQEDSGISTFHEYWTLEWQPEFAIRLIEASVWGSTIEQAASNRLAQRSGDTATLPQLAALLDQAILAALPEASERVLQRIQHVSAVGSDVATLMESLPPLVRIWRYGDVRETSKEQLTPLLIGIFERILSGLPAACTGIDEEIAERMRSQMQSTQEAASLLERPELLTEWFDQLARLSSGSAASLLQGWCCRSLLEAGRLSAEDLERRLSAALSHSADVQAAAQWIDGLLRGSGLLILYQDSIWNTLDDWLCRLSGDAFLESLPLLRRAFSDFSHAERRQMGARLQDRASAPAPGHDQPMIDVKRAALVLPVLAEILGRRHD